MSSYRVRLEGRSPLVHHSNTMVNPLSKEKKALSALTGKKPKTDADYLAIQKLEFTAGLYHDKRLGVIIPCQNLRKMLIEGARKNKKGKQFEAGLIVEGDAVLEFPGQGKTIEELYEDYAWTVPAGNQKSTIMRTRPRFDEWACEFDVLLEESLVDKSDLAAALKAAEIAVGICDARALGMGRFYSKVLEPKASNGKPRAEVVEALV